ncbi:phage minor head protein [Rhodococcus qingshengii]|uniref:phage minor head protein n=1 Tax=Rhodococcus qingshengii TaxID=334542 RepID=UPI0029439293|nr:phage minor head protein [Rhodococcus qingshengii]WOI85986.1 phage minor head protein [Rhodococcus qingshengii]
MSKLDVVPVKNSLTASRRKAWLDDVVDWASFDDEFVKAITPILLGLVYDVGTVAYQEVAVDAGVFTVFNDAVQSYLRQRSTKIAVDVNDETEKQLRATLAEGVSAGENSFELRARVEGVFGFAATTRADRIARTESTRATAFADIAAWGQSGVVEAKEWYTAKDERVCKWCGAMDGQIVGLQDNYFDKGDVQSVDGTDSKGEPKVFAQHHDYDDVIGPPNHVNCRCTLLPVLVEG